jgi:hypothetical protein
MTSVGEAASNGTTLTSGVSSSAPRNSTPDGAAGPAGDEHRGEQQAEHENERGPALKLTAVAELDRHGPGARMADEACVDQANQRDEQSDAPAADSADATEA